MSDVLVVFMVSMAPIVLQVLMVLQVPSDKMRTELKVSTVVEVPDAYGTYGAINIYGDH